MKQFYTFLAVVALSVLAGLYVTGHLPDLDEIRVLKIGWFVLGGFIGLLVWLNDTAAGHSTKERLCNAGIPIAIFTGVYIIARAVALGPPA